jgi:hypothetical protein
VSRSHAFIVLLKLSNNHTLAVVNCHLSADPAKEDSRITQVQQHLDMHYFKKS